MRAIPSLKPVSSLLLVSSICVLSATGMKGENQGSSIVKQEHSEIGIPTVKDPARVHTAHPDAQWFPDAGFGLFLHWSPCSVLKMNISHTMIPGRALGKKRITDPAERERIIREQDYNLNGKKPEITPNAYWALAQQFNPSAYDPDKWCKAAKETGFTYVVLTTRHHDGFAMWPSAFGTYNTKNFMGGRDLVKPFVDACRKYGLKVGLYYSPPDWYYEREYKNFLYCGAAKKNPEFPQLDADLMPRKEKPVPKDKAAYEAGYDGEVKGQVEELLTRYGKIDLLWFDGCQPTPNGSKSITAERIRELQPGIVINPRLHGTGDFITYERNLKTNKIAKTWAEFCNTWALLWTYDKNRPFRSNAFILGQLATSRSLGINYLLGIGPDAQGELHPDAYKNMAAIAPWMKIHQAALIGAKPLPSGEKSNVPATSLGNRRFLFAIPDFGNTSGNAGPYDSDMRPPGDVTMTLSGISSAPKEAKLMGDGSAIPFDFNNGVVTVHLPKEKRTRLVDVVELSL